ncbi:GNAT family N-acetyltransferase [Halobaculum sp. MBLA0143]|uniref:GNAT family N-acetyltransferase n=1 Tax=Halobaculum sp. MBLA0143 TaxID=3079933 RepID=UPI003523D430
MAADHRVRSARPAETAAVRRLLSAALLEPPPDLSAAVADGHVHVVADGGGRGRTAPVGCLVRRPPTTTPDADAVVAALRALDGPPFDPADWRETTAASHVDAVAVARGRRGRGVGRALVAAARSAVDAPVTTAFRPAVRPFYEALDFRVTSVPDADRLVAWDPL